jgi:23S rRNA (uracil1939-C5)-methyltransferase
MIVGDTLTCRIETLAYGGDGIARVDGRVVFIPETAAGETVSVRVTALKKRFARAEAGDILSPSPFRISPCCRVRDSDTGGLCRVPGCVYDHLAYDFELQAKQSQLEGFFRRLPQSAEFAFLPPFAAPAPLHYRNKIVLHTDRRNGRVRLGYRTEPSHAVLDLSACPLACEPLNAALASLRSSDAFNRLPHDADVTFRHTAHDGALWWVNNGPPSAPSPDTLTEASASGPLSVPRDGFFQVNPAVGDALVRAAAAWFADGPEAAGLLDLYCGVGVFGFACMQAGGSRLTGVESGRAAIAAAKLNAAALGIDATFLCRALGQEEVPLAGLIGDPRRTTAIVDPPRDGLPPSLARALAESGIARLLYVSCDPATLARDLAVLLSSGRYRLARARLFDMFPRTAHFETLVELRRT